MSHPFFDATISKVIDETEHVKRYFIQIPQEVPFHFRAGQFIMLDLPIPSKVTNRSYSIASAPSNDRQVELCLVLKPGGLGSTYIYKNFKAGATIKMSQPLGKFSLPEIIDTDLCFIGTGTGIAPLRSMLLHLFNQHIPYKKLYLVYGNRWERDILYRSELEALMVGHPEFTFIPVLSRENPGWKGRTGYVHAVVEELFADRRPANFYLCGYTDMLREGRQRLEFMGYARQAIHFETFS